MGIGPDCRFGETGGAALNPNGITTRIERCLIYNSFIGIEGWTGELGGYLKARFVDCERGSIQGGTFNGDAARGGYYRLTYPTDGVVPLGDLDIVMERSGLDIGSALRGRVTATDCCPSIGNAAAFNNGVTNTDLDVISVSDTSHLSPGVLVLGGAQGSMSTDDIVIRLVLRRTAAASQTGLRHVHGSGSYGSFGPNVHIRIMETYPEVGQHWAAFAPVYDNQPHVSEG